MKENQNTRLLVQSESHWTRLGDSQKWLHVFFWRCNSSAIIPKVPNLGVFLHKVQQASNLLFSAGFSRALNVVFSSQIWLKCPHVKMKVILTETI